MVQHSWQLMTPCERLITVSAFPAGDQLTTLARIRTFELLRLAFFVLKLRKLQLSDAFLVQEQGHAELSQFPYYNLLRHAIFQQIVRLSDLGGRAQALRLVEAAHIDLPEGTGASLSA
ncbi:MAG TPA: hypothetical protein VL461_11590 [Dictyobacter sp.]|nr:hypothetical protein [Dictyobacter sp.]